MDSIVPHMIVKDDRIADLLVKTGYKTQEYPDLTIVYQDIPVNVGLTKKVRESFDQLSRVEERFEEPHILVRESIRGKLVDRKPKGFIVELTDDGPSVHNIEQMESIPILAGYGSLLDPGKLAGLTIDDHLRISPDTKLAIKDRIGYARISGLQLTFNRSSTKKRYGATQEKRNDWAMLNSRLVKDSVAYVVLFDPCDLTSDPLSYLAKENFDEKEYGRRRIDPKDIQMLGKTDLALEKGVWVLDSPLITDIDGTLHPIIPNEHAKISDSYIDMITDGLVGADEQIPGFAYDYVKNIRDANGRSLYENSRFMDTLEKKTS